MSNAVSAYARKWHIDNPIDDHTVALLAVATNRIWTANVASHPKLDSSGKKELNVAIKRFRELNKDALENGKSYIEEKFRAFGSQDPEVYGNIWANDEVFSRYYRSWKVVMIHLKFPMMILPGWPPKTQDGEDVYDYNRDMEEDLKAMFGREAGSDPDVAEEEVVIPNLIFPDNVDRGLEAQVALWICAYYNEYTGDSFEQIANFLIKSTGLKVKVGDDPKEINVLWDSDKAFEDAELAYIDAHGKHSEYFISYKEGAGDDIPDWVSNVERYLSKKLAKPAEGSEEVVTRDGTLVGANPSAGEDQPSSSSSLPLPPQLVYKDFDASLRKNIVVNPKHKVLLDIVAPAYMHIVDDRLKIRDIPPTVNNVRLFCKENELEETELDDASFAGICVTLASTGGIEANTDGDVPEAPPVVNATKITQVKITSWGKAARRMVDAAFAFASQGAKDGELSWYDSFAMVFGRIMKARRFVQVCELIMASGFLDSYTQDTSISVIRGANNVIGYRLIRLSSPVLVMEAFRLVENSTIYRMIDPVALKSYVQFYQGGILAQVAAGPLKGYCRGDIDVLTTANIPADVKISELKAIDRAPYDDRILRQAYIVLDVYNRLPSRWYQGEKAMRGMDARDTVFEAVVKAYKASEKIAAENQVKETSTLVIDKILGSEELYEEVRSVLKMKGPGM